MSPNRIRNTCRIGWISISVVSVFLVSSAIGQEIQWHRDAEFTQHLQLPVDVTWDRVPLREGVMRIAKTSRIAVFLDRRVDPGQRITAEFKNEPLELLFKKLAVQLNLGYTTVGNTVYLGPLEVAKRLATVADVQLDFTKSRNDPVSIQLIREETLQVPEAETPRQLLQALANRCDTTWTNLEQVIPHDVWPSIDLPRMRRTEALALLLAGFDATYRYQTTPSGISLTLIPIPNELALTKRYQFDGNHADAVQKIEQFLPNVKVKSDGKEIIVAASSENHRLIAQMLRGGKTRRTTVEMGEKRYTLKVNEQPLGGILKSLGPQLGYTVRLPEDGNLAQRVTFSVEQATLEQLLEAIIDGTEFTFQIQEKEQIILIK